MNTPTSLKLAPGYSGYAEIKNNSNPDYMVYLYSNKPEKFNSRRESIKPEILTHFNGANIGNFSRIINKCIEQCPTETMVLISDKIMPRPHQVQKILTALDLGYAFASSYRFGFYGFKKELFRRIGMFDERFTPGGHEDLDFFVRLKEANLAVYMVDDADYSYGTSSWSAEESRKHWYAKWHEHGDSALERLLDEDSHNYNLGDSVPTKFLDYSWSYIKYSHRTRDIIKLLNKKIIISRKILPL